MGAVGTSQRNVLGPAAYAFAGPNGAGTSSIRLPENALFARTTAVSSSLVDTATMTSEFTMQCRLYRFEATAPATAPTIVPVTGSTGMPTRAAAAGLREPASAPTCFASAESAVRSE